MSKVITPRKFIVLVAHDVLDGLLELSGGPELELIVEDYYSCVLNQDYYIVELTDTMSFIERDISTIYLLTGAIALHEEETSGVFIDKEDVDKVNDVFGYNGGGAALLYSMLSGPERLELIRTSIEKMCPLLGPGEVFVRILTLEEMGTDKFNSRFFEENWEDLDDFYDTFSDDTIEVRSVDGMKLATFGTCIDDMPTIMTMTGMQCYVFDLDIELKKATEVEDDEIEILDIGKQVKFDPETGEIVEEQALLPAPRPQDILLTQYQKGHITKEEYEAQVLIILNAVQAAKAKENKNKKPINALTNPYYDFKDKDASEMKNELREAWQNFGWEDDYYGHE